MIFVSAGIASRHLSELGNRLSGGCRRWHALAEWEAALNKGFFFPKLRIFPFRIGKGDRRERVGNIELLGIPS